MSDIWDTKDGRRRVRRDPPTVEEAVQAAQGLTEELSEQIEIVASLMDVSSEEARGAVLRMGQRKDVNRFTIAGRAGAPRAVVVERRVTRRPLRTGIDRALKCQRPLFIAGIGDHACGHQAMPDEQHDDRADDGRDQSRALVRAVVADRLTNQGREERAGDPK